jgi:hypothetical protein
MALAYVLDEHLRGILSRAIQQHNAGSAYTIDAVQVGDPIDLPLGSLDPDILLWAEREGRVLVTLDQGTMLSYLAAHLQAGHHCPGIFLIRPGATIPQIVDSLVLAAHAGDPTILRDSYEYIP